MTKDTPCWKHNLIMTWSCTGRMA